MRRRKLLSLFLSLCLCLSLLPTAVLAEDVQTEPLTEVAVTFPAPKAGENISEAMKAASGNADSGLTLYLTGPALWKQGEEPDKLDENAVYAEGNTYLLNFTFYTQKPITDETVLTCNGKPITRYADYRALTEALDAYDGTQDACLAFVMFSEDGIGDPSMAEVKNVYVVGLSTFVRVPKTLTTAEAATADALRTAIGTGTDDIVKLTEDITIEARLDIARDVTVDLNGCVLRYDETADPDSIFRVKSNCALTLTDSRPQAEHEDTTLPAGGLITGGKGFAHDNGAGQSYTYFGGGVYVETGASFVLAGGTIYACGVRSGAISAFGGGIYAEGGSVTVTGGAIRNCVVSTDYGASGGAIYAKAGSVTMSGGVISGCSAKDGGGILTSGCTVQITGGRIENCKASGCGGGLSVNGHTNGPVSVLDTVISGCEAKRGGGLALIGFAELELGKNASITGCTATEKDDTEAGAIEYGAAIYMDLESTYTINYPGCFLYANGGRVEGSVYVGRNGRNQDATIKATNAIDHTDGKPSTVFTGDVYCEGDIRGGSFYGSVTATIPYYLDWDECKNFWSNISGGSFYGPVRTECHVSGGTFYRGLTMNKNAKLSGQPIDTGDVINDKTNIPNPNSTPVTVTYEYGKLDGIYAKQIVQTGETAIRPTDPKVNGFTFLGWYTDAGCTDGNEYDFTVPVTADFTLYAKWEGTYYGIRITDKDGNAVYVTNKNSTNVLGDGTVVYVPGYWNEEDIPAEYWADDTHTILTAEAQEKLLADGEIPGIRLPRLTLNGAELQEIAVRAGWGADPQTQRLNTFLQLELMGKNSISNSEERGAGILCPLGLYLIVSGDGSLDVTADYAISTEGGGFYQRGGEVTLSARRMGIAHSYSHYLQFYGGKLTIQVTSTESNNDYGALPFNGDDTFQIMDGATFRVGNSAEDNVLITLPSSDEFKPVDIFDQWGEKVTTSKPYYLSLTANYTVTFDTDGGSEVKSQTVAYGGQAAVPAAPAKPGYTFAGWYLDGKAYDFDAPVTENLTLTANWTVNRYTITFDTDGGSAIAPITQDYGTAVTAPADPTRTGYTFAGWTPEIPATMPAKNMTIKAKWTVNQYTITFDTDGGSAIAPITQDYGTAVTAPAEPTRTGYTFAGWTPAIPEAMPAENLTIKAKWTVNTYTITYDLDGGTAEGNPASYTVESGAITLAEPAKPGYTFTGWSGTDLEGADNLDVTIPAGSTGDRSYTAHWQVNTVYSTLRFETRGGSALATLALPYGSRVDLTKYVPTREGFAFTGWYTDRELTQRVTSLTLTNSTVVYAGWNPFTDVGSGDWFYEDVLYVYNQGLMEGTGADTFSPDAAVTRGQVVTILWRMAGSPAVNFAMDFSDVTEDTWCAEAIRWAASEGIAQGFADGSFGQDVYVSREQLAAFLYREVQHQGGGFTGMWYFPLNYPDIEELGAFADEAMHWCVMTGVLQGTADGRLAPKATADRAQLSAILHRYLTVEK